ncbi:MAG: DUF6249 domain-containing protein [Casimicrobiaceae bacterium]
MSMLFDPRSWRRRLVLGVALVAAIGAVAVTPPSPPVLVSPVYAQAQPADSPGATPHAATDGPQSLPTPSTVPPAAKRNGKATLGITIDDDNDKITLSGLGAAHEYDSFADFMHQSPWVAGLFFVAILLVFLVPLLVIVLVLWYKVRKTRMLNETMLKLAERGVVPPAEAMDALGAARPQASVAASPVAGALYARAAHVRSRGVWSDLRRGIILVAVGLGVQTCSMIQDGEANGVALVLLFLGIGYIVLWYFEDRRTPVTPREDSGADRTP